MEMLIYIFQCYLYRFGLYDDTVNAIVYLFNTHSIPYHIVNGRKYSYHASASFSHMQSI